MKRAYLRRRSPRRSKGGSATYRIPRKEIDLTNACLMYAQVEENAGRILWVDRYNSGKIPATIGYRSIKTGEVKYSSRKIRLHRAGTADIAITPCKNNLTQMIWVETKRIGEIPNKDQLEFRAKMEKAGHFYWLVYSIDDFIRDLMMFYGMTKTNGMRP